MEILEATFFLWKRLASVLLTGFSLGQFCVASFFHIFQTGRTQWPLLRSPSNLTCSLMIFIAFCLSFNIRPVFTGHYLLLTVGFFVFNSAQGSKAHTALSTRYTGLKACDERTLLAVDISFFAVVLHFVTFDLCVSHSLSPSPLNLWRRLFFYLQLICINSWSHKCPHCQNKYPHVLNNSNLQSVWFSEPSPC